MTGKGKQLSPEDRILWGKVARTVDALPGRMEDLFSTATEPPAKPADPVKKQKNAAQSATPSLTGDKRRKQKHPGLEPGLNPIDGTVYRKIARGRLPLEASIDLHGLNQSQAYGLLHGFLARAHQRGLRHVLVITGKGGSYGSQGVLRRAVPQWLRAPEYRAIASGCEPAARGHGGDGALYIRLRKQDREI
jgi:DNA-nicking Smr family endonuclease